MLGFFNIGALMLRLTTRTKHPPDKPMDTLYSHEPAIPEPLTTPSTNHPPQPAMTTTTDTTSRHFTPIRLGTADPVDSATIERHHLAFKDTAMCGLASRCAAALERLTRQAAYAHFLSQAAEAAQADGITPAAWLERTLRAIEAEADATRIEHRRHDARQKARSTRLAPLKMSVSRRLTSVEREIQVLHEKILCAEKAPSDDKARSKQQRLIDAGLTLEQIARLAPEDLVSKIVKDARERIAELEPQLTALWAFSRDPRSSPEHLAGLPEFEALIAAQSVAEEVMPCQA